MTYDMRDYAAMFADPVRGRAYLDALHRSVTPGCVVADIGAGPGVLGVYAAILGARRVFLVEPDASVEAAVAFARENGVEDRVEIIRSLSTAVTLPERADVIVSDLRGVLPLFGAHLDAARDMRARHLQPGGVCIPARDRISIALVEKPDAYETVRAWDALPEQLHHESLDRHLANAWFRVRLSPAHLLSSAEEWLELDYSNLPSTFDGTVETTLSRDGTAHGVGCWFDTELTADIHISNSPSAPPALYGQAFFPLATPVQVRKGDVAAIRLRAVRLADEHVWTWSLRLTRGAELITSLQQSTLDAVPLSARMLARREQTFVPERGPDAEAVRVMLELVDGSRTLSAIAAELRMRLNGRFASDREALDFVASHETLWK